VNKKVKSILVRFTFLHKIIVGDSEDRCVCSRVIVV